VLKISIFDEWGSINLNFSFNFIGFGCNQTFEFMSVQTKSNLPQDEALKWNLAKAAIEFSTTADTLKKALNQISASPDPDGLFTTAQLCEAIYGSMYKAKLATQHELTRKLELENAITTASVVNRAELERVFAELADALVGVVKNSNLDRRS
jgi:hypothetical protein